MRTRRKNLGGSAYFESPSGKILFYQKFLQNECVRTDECPHPNASAEARQPPAIRNSVDGWPYEWGLDKTPGKVQYQSCPSLKVT